jgi:hypothetical protein
MRGVSSEPGGKVHPGGNVGLSECRAGKSVRMTASEKVAEGQTGANPNLQLLATGNISTPSPGLIV